MQVTVELFSYFRKSGFKGGALELDAGATVADLLTQLDIKRPEVGVIVINGEAGTAKRRLQAGDRVTLIPIIGGG
jgi:sulfur carrier protein ThiS